MSFEINERVTLVKQPAGVLVEVGVVGTVTAIEYRHPRYPYKVLFDTNMEYWMGADEIKSTGVVTNVPPHSCSINLFEPVEIPAEVVAEVEEAALGMKYDGDKPRMDLLIDGMPGALEQVASILTFGAKKYADHSWQAVPNGPARYKAALLRHLTAHAKGELNDPESGMAHLAHAACNALFILQLEMNSGTTI